ncbi:protein adenylyltransferase SelO [Methylibium sp.]|uniref:protein adenylyltransferase SelO n=1 Tax=Methylibium sp. TaxID=2067992 RepID=UPI003D132C8E
MSARMTLAALGPPYATVASATLLPGAERLIGNDALAAELGLAPQAWHGPEATQLFAGNRPWPGYAPRATVYAGHQFGRYTRQLGDGRALLIAELDTGQGRRELQLKGAGPTPYARGSDGRAVLRSSLREYLASEAMHALGVPTTRALSLVTSKLAVQRERTETAAVVCRVAPSFLRFGHFEYYAHSAQFERLAVLAHHVVAQHFPHLADVAAPGERHAQWLTEVVERQARLIAMWQTLGFCHGVMNTDNCSVLGLTLDYGPFGFMERFRAHHVCNHSDTEGRYAYRAQPAIGQWNCARLLDACASLLHDEPEAAGERARAILPAYERAYNATVMQRWRAKLGLHEAREGDAALVNRLLTLMQQGRCDFTLSFRALGDQDLGALRTRYSEPAAFDAWWADWQLRAASEGVGEAERRERMRRVNPRFVLRNHLAQTATEAAERGDASALQDLLRVLQRPFDEHAASARFAQPAPAGQPALEVSCSS